MERVFKGMLSLIVIQWCCRVYCSNSTRVKSSISSNSKSVLGVDHSASLYQELIGGDLNDMHDYMIHELYSHKLQKKETQSLQLEPFKVENYSLSVKMCKLLYEKLSKTQDLNHEEITVGEDIYENLIEALTQTDSESEDLVRSSIENPMICWDMKNFIAKRKMRLTKSQIEMNKMYKPSSSLLSQESFFEVHNLTANDDPSCTMKRCTRRTDPNSCISNIKVADQSQCGSCWIFGSMLLLELNICQEFDQVPRDFSEGYLADCFGYNKACGGGWASEVVNRINRQKVIKLEEQHAYIIPPSSARCSKGPSKDINVFKGWNFKKLHTMNLPYYSEGKNYIMEGWLKDHMSNLSKFDEFLRATVLKKGGITISIALTPSIEPSGRRNSLTKKLSYPPLLRCDIYGPDHMVVMTGFGTYQDSSGNTREYYEFRNSWGESWGDNGYFRLDRMGPSGCQGQIFYGYEGFQLIPPKQLDYTDECKKGGKCKNKSKCVLKNPKDGSKSGVTCKCLPGWKGSYCDTYDKVTDPTCDKNPCKNKGVCELSDQFNYTCKCEKEWAGKNCDLVNACLNEPCEKDKKCHVPEAGGYECLTPSVAMGTTEISLLAAGSVLAVGLIGFMTWYKWPEISLHSLNAWNRLIGKDEQYEYEYYYE